MADWKIINGSLPFKDDFPTRPTSFDDYPDWIWHKVANELPYKVMFPTRYAIDDAPEAMWKIDTDLPFKSSFARVYGIDDAPNSLWRKEVDGLPYKVVFPKMPPRPKMEKPYKAKAEVVMVSSYAQNVICKQNYEQQIVLGEYSQTVITTEW